MTDAPLKPCKPSCQTCLWSETYKAWMSEIDGFLGIVAWDFCPFCGRELLSGGESVDRAEAAEAERDALREQLEWLRERGIIVRWAGFTGFGGYLPDRIKGDTQSEEEFEDNLAAAVAAEKDGGDGA